MNHITAHPQVAAFRLSRHHLASHHPANLITVCRNVCFMQAQTMAAAELQSGRGSTISIAPKVGKNIKKYMELAWSIQLFRHALVEGLICYGPRQDKRATFVRVDRWLPEQKEIPELEAKRILLRLLPHFDPYLLAHADKDHLVSPAFYKKIYRKAGWIFPVFLLDGRVIGVWSYKRRGK